MDNRTLAALEQLYSEVRDVTGRLDVIHAGRMACKRGCSSCCVDGITVWEVEAAYIRHYEGRLLSNSGVPSREGCAFLDSDGACRIYQHRPYVCRTQGYPLRWLEDPGGEELLELRDICPLNETADPIEELPEAACWSIGPFEERLAQLQAGFGDSRMARVFLRDLFS